jgi:hypothetical protein
MGILYYPLYHYFGGCAYTCGTIGVQMKKKKNPRILGKGGVNLASA